MVADHLSACYNAVGGKKLMINCLFVGIGGFVGSVCRYLMGLLPIETSQGFPVKTLLTNVIGAFVMGVINQGLSIMGVDTAVVKTIKGLVLLLAVAVDIMSKRKKS